MRLDLRKLNPDLKRLALLLMVIFTIVIAPLNSLAAKEKMHDWKRGMLISSEDRDASRLYQGTSVVRIYWTYTVDDGTYVWKLERDTRRHDKPLDVTVNTQVEFAIEGQDAYMKDDHGEAHKLSVESKALKKVQE